MAFCNFEYQNKATIDKETFFISSAIYKLKSGEEYRDFKKYTDGLENIINFVKDDNFWYKNRILRIYYDHSLDDDESFSSLKGRHCTDGSVVKFIKYKN